MHLLHDIKATYYTDSHKKNNLVNSAKIERFRAFLVKAAKMAILSQKMVPTILMKNRKQYFWQNRDF